MNGRSGSPLAPPWRGWPVAGQRRKLQRHPPGPPPPPNDDNNDDASRPAAQKSTAAAVAAPPPSINKPLPPRPAASQTTPGRWDWSEQVVQVDTYLSPRSDGGLDAYLAALQAVSAAPPPDVAERYGLLESILCVLGRNEFEADVPAPEAAARTLAAQAAAAAVECLETLTAPETPAAPAVLTWLVNFRWGAHDLVRAAVRGIAGADALVLRLARSSAAGYEVVQRALEDAAAAARVYCRWSPPPQLRVSVNSFHGDTITTAIDGTDFDGVDDLAAVAVLQAALLTAHTSPTVSLGASDLGEPQGNHPSDEQCFQAEVRRLNRAVACAWQTSAWRSWPLAMRTRPAEERERTAAKLRALNLAQMSPDLGTAQRKKLNQEMTRLVLDVQPEFVTAMVDAGVFNQSKVFSDMARASDPALADKDEYQAGRNAWACFGLQLLACPPAPVECSSAVLGYSMLYPYTDNLLDQPSLSSAHKRTFQAAFRARLLGDLAPPPPTLPVELVPLLRKVWAQVASVEAKWPRQDHTNVYLALAAINDAQTASLGQHVPVTEASYGEILDITCYKGGTSVLADLYVCMGSRVRRRAAAYAYHLGLALQIVDDLQDVAEDSAAGQQTLFTVPHVLRGQHADAGARRLAHMLVHIITHHDPTIEARRTMLGQGKLAMCMSMVLKAIMRAQPMFSSGCLDEAEERSPLPRAEMAKLAGMRTLMRLVKMDAI